jgi:hypothetical protein
MALNRRDTLLFAGSAKGPVHVRSWPEIVGSSSVTPLVEPATYENPEGKLSVIVSNVTAMALGLLTVISYCTVPPGYTKGVLVVFAAESTVAPG